MSMRFIFYFLSRWELVLNNQVNPITGSQMQVPLYPLDRETSEKERSASQWTPIYRDFPSRYEF